MDRHPNSRASDLAAGRCAALWKGFQRGQSHSTFGFPRPQNSRGRARRPTTETLCCPPIQTCHSPRRLGRPTEFTWISGDWASLTGGDASFFVGPQPQPDQRVSEDAPNPLPTRRPHTPCRSLTDTETRLSFLLLALLRTASP